MIFLIFSLHCYNKIIASLERNQWLHLRPWKTSQKKKNQNQNPCITPTHSKTHNDQKIGAGSVFSLKNDKFQKKDPNVLIQH